MPTSDSPTVQRIDHLGWSSAPVEERTVPFRESAAVWEPVRPSDNVVRGSLSLRFEHVVVVPGATRSATPRAMLALGGDLERLRGAFATSVAQALGESASLSESVEGDDTHFTIEYDPHTLGELDDRVEKVSALRSELVRMIPEPLWGKVSIFIEPK